MNGDCSLAGALEDTADHAALGLGPVLVGAGHTIPLAAAAASIAAGVRSGHSLNSLDFSQSRIGVKIAFSTNAQSRFVSALCDRVLHSS